jgi:hypothetical protein
MNNKALQRMIDEWFDGYVRQYGHAPAWGEFVEKVNFFKFLLDID